MHGQDTSQESRIAELEAMVAAFASFLRETAQARSLDDLNLAAGGTLEDVAAFFPASSFATALAALHRTERLA